MMKSSIPGIMLVLVVLFNQVLILPEIFMGKRDFDGCWKRFSVELELDSTILLCSFLA